nr:PREDICTED: facilitated trehalose transporter Tret1-like isoform X1 [Bemisia tabaci]XP_018908720.1 PREDICTED: facilitated trehalose transporter Tret1-like isoform X1 [Bemisia tabaci]XP_018908721.1 PREDICTED: facilitated trehalose transporter Tret1-like isoform X1 [Bemisia tabaci]
MTEPDSTPPSSGCCRPFLVISSLFPLYVCVGALFGESAGMLPQLMEEDSLIPTSREEATWIASVPTIGTCIAATTSGSLSDVFGRIRMVQMAYFLLGMGYGIIGAANDFTLLVVGRFLAGVGVGCSFPANVYVSEMAPPAYRGLFLVLNPLLASTGLVYMYVVGVYLPWNIAALFSCLIAFLGLLLTFFCRDSPVWLLRKNRPDAARRSLAQIEGPANVDARLKQLQEIADAQRDAETQSGHKTFSLRVLASPTVWKPYLTVLILSALQNISGFYIVISYTVNFMREFHSTFDPLQATVAIGVVRLAAICVTSALLRHVGRRTIGAVSGFGAAASLLLVYWCLVKPELAPNAWTPMALFLAYIFTMTLGIFPLPWTMPYEMFPIKVRGTMCGVSFCSMYGLMFVSVKLYNTLLDNLRLEGMILLFAAGSLVFGLYSATLLVETHRKTLDEIEAVFAGKRTKKVDG